MARSESTGWGFVKATDHRLAAAKGGRAHLGVHWCNVMRKALHGENGPSVQVVSHGKVHGTVGINKNSEKPKTLKYVILIQGHMQ